MHQVRSRWSPDQQGATLFAVGLCTSFGHKTCMSPEARFEQELAQLRRDSNAAIQFLYAWVSFHACAGRSAQIRRAINRTPLFWNTSLSALQTSLFIVLGRIFDRNPKSHSLERLLGEAVQSPKIFSRTALAKRKAQQSPGATWINEYAKDAYVPDPADFQRLRRYAQIKRLVYEKAYEKIRHKIFAHSGVVSRQKSDELFSKTNIMELQRLVLSLSELHESLWQLYINGRKPSIRRFQYSIASLRQRAFRKDGHVPSVQETVVDETFNLLESYKTEFQQTAVRERPEKRVA